MTSTSTGGTPTGAGGNLTESFIDSVITEYGHMKLLSKEEFYQRCPQHCVDGRPGQSERSGRGRELMYQIYQIHRAVELCVFRTLSPYETRQVIVHRLNLDPAVFDVVWRCLREQNKHAFRAYEARMRYRNELSETEDDATSISIVI
mmetsp:Transcript_33687/g.95296  ORF Transcript_33687/g.95296 Transcript_33687/m.95296 type:complete len:147 (+) Transcript_33687:277-717(+)